MTDTAPRSAPPLFHLLLDGTHGRIAVAGAATEETARSVGLSPTEAGRVRTLVEGVVSDAVERITSHVDEPVTVSATVDGTLLRVTVCDQGEPTDHSSLPSFVTALLDAGVAEGVRVDPPGAHGNRMVIDIALPTHREAVEGEVRAESDERAPEDEPLEIRRMRADEVLALSKGIHSCYGYTYPDHDYYFPERLVARLASPDWYSYVAVNPEGRIVAHVEQDFRDNGRIRHGGGAFTDPRYRGRNLLARLGEFSAADNDARDPQAVLLFSEAVTTHPITQRMGIGEGLIECGIFLAWRPAQRQEGFNDDAATILRSTARPGIMPLQPLVHRTIHPPAFVSSYVQRIVDQHDLPRAVEAPRPRALEDGPEKTRRVVQVNREAAAASITVTTVGRDLTDVIAADLEALQRQAVYVELCLPVGDPVVATAAAGLDELSFVFCALLPEYRDTGDELRLQWLPNAEFDPDAMVLHTEFLQGLVADVISDVRRAKERDADQRRRRATTRRIFAALD